VLYYGAIRFLLPINLETQVGNTGRKSIYTTNLIEALNSQIKRQLKGKKQFSTVEAAEKILVAMFEEYNFKNSQYKHCGFKNI
ncbi:transposase, partial [Mycoplasma sp. Z473B]|uniref:transposase n=1 Tax=Mycoplasma sp. Z473B TaxID=3401667 RepID=UPI003AB05789